MNSQPSFLIKPFCHSVATCALRTFASDWELALSRNLATMFFEPVSQQLNDCVSLSLCASFCAFLYRRRLLQYCVGHYPRRSCCTSTCLH